MRKLDDYRFIVGDNAISEITRLAKPLYGARVLHINSTYYGGGVAEMLYSLIPLMNDAGVEADWRILRGTPEFFTITKKFHNALQGEHVNLTDQKKKIYLENNEDFASYCQINADCVIIHDPQVLPLIRYYKRKQPWIWRCHIDLSQPNDDLWEYLKGFVLRYDGIIVSDEKYIKNDLPVEHSIIHPVIDPLSSKNKDITQGLIMKTLRKYNIPMDKPLLAQVSRFDKWKDPENVVEIFKIVKNKIDCRLVLLGSMASDDPEGWPIYERIKQKANRYLTNGDIFLITSEDNILVNALQRVAAVIIQKSIKEGFGLTVTEALWKERPVIASNVGGIPLQIINGKTGYLVDPYDISRFAELITYILENSEQGRAMGAEGKEHVRGNFLVTRHVLDELRLLNELLVPGKLRSKLPPTSSVALLKDDNS